MSSIGNNSSSQAAAQKPIDNTTSMRTIMNIVDKVEGKITLLGAKEGQTAEHMGNTQVSLAKNYKSYINNYVSKANMYQKFAMVMAIGTAVTGALGAGGLLGGSAISSMTEMSAAAEGVADGATALGAFTQVAGNIGTSVTAKEKGDAQGDEEISSGTLKLVEGNSDELTSDVGSTLNYNSSGKSAIRSLLQNENRASEYQG